MDKKTEELTYKIKCRNCGKVTKMWLGTTEKTSPTDFNKWAIEHSSFPFQVQCDCDNGSIMIHDMVSYKIMQ